MASIPSGVVSLSGDMMKAGSTYEYFQVVTSMNTLLFHAAGFESIRKGKSMAILTPESREFLSRSTYTGKLATVRADGRPHIAPIWFVVDDDSLIFMTGKTTVKAINMRRDNRVTLCVDDQDPPFSFAIIEGTATLTENAPDLLEWSTRIAARYMGDAKAEEYGKRNAVPSELLVRLTATKIILQKDIAE
jgi:PPOX class probable F420-dependent enzyme